MGKAVSILNADYLCRGKRILSSINWEVKRGSCNALLGANGAGKSTIISIVCGYTWPSEGSVEVLGERLGKTDISKIREKIGLVETSRVPEFSGRILLNELVGTGFFGTLILPWYKDMTEKMWEKVHEELGHFGLYDLRDQFFGELSTGEKAKALIARAMVSEPELLVLDEPTAGLDIKGRAEVVDILERIKERDDNPTLIVVSHHLDELPVNIDKVTLLKEGRILKDGKPAEVITSKNLSEAFGCNISVVKNDGRFTAAARI